MSEEEREDWKRRCSCRPDYVPHTGHTYVHSEEAKDRIREFQKNRIHSEDEVERMKAGRKGKGKGERNSMANPEHREKQRLACIGRKRTYREDGSWYWSK